MSPSFRTALWAAALASAVVGTACQKSGKTKTAPTGASSSGTNLAVRDNASSGGASLTDDPSVAAIELLMPKGAFTTPTPALRWTALDQATSFDVLIDDSEDCTSPLQTAQSTITSLTTQYLANGVYFVCVTARDAHGTTMATTKGSFWVLAQDAADPAAQNGQGASGGALTTPGLMALPYFQDDWTAKQPNRDGRGPRRDTVGTPYGFFAFADPADGDKLKLLVNDRGNHRVLIFANVPSRPDALPDVVVGQADFDSGRRGGEDGGVNNAGFGDNVQASVCPSGQLLVTDRGNHRVLMWRHVPADDGTPADLVIGQANFAADGSGAGAAHLTQPAAAYCMGGKLLVVDRGNNRILVWNKMPSRNGTAADYAIGQDDLDGTDAACAPDGLSAPSEALYTDGRLFVADAGNNRVVAYPKLPQKFGAKATLVLGQTDGAHCRANRGGAAGPATLSGPTALASRDGALAVGDSANHRVLLYQAPLTTGADATSVIGQPDLSTTHLSEPPEFATIDLPRGLLFDGSLMWIGDAGNHRLMVVPVP